MKNHNHRFINKSVLWGVLAVVSLIILPSCEDFFLSEVDQSKVPGSEPKLVVYSYISPQDTLIRVFVHRTRPYTQNPADAIPVGAAADVSMAKMGDPFVRLAYDESLKCFVIGGDDFLVEAGQEYLLQVETPEGEFVEASSRVPDFEPEDVAMEPYQFIRDVHGNQRLIIEWNVEVPSGVEERFFRTGSYIYSCTEHVTWDEVYCNNNTVWLERGNELFSDADGATHAFRGEFWGYVNLEGADVPYYFPEGYSQTDSVFIFVLQTDLHYHRFHQSAEQYQYHDDDFPFAEPVHLYSNIRGGLGVFAAYNRRDFLVAATVE